MREEFFFFPAGVLSPDDYDVGRCSRDSLKLLLCDTRLLT